MPKDEIIRLRCSAADKERFKAAAEAAGESLSEFLLHAGKLRAAHEEHSVATSQKLTTNDIKIPPPVAEPLDAQGVQLSGGITLGKRSFRPDPK